MKTNSLLKYKGCKGHALFLLLVMLSVAAHAQESKDSVQVLDEVVVEAEMERATATSTTYRPSQKVKNAAQNAIDLLQRMTIPQIRIDPLSSSVTTNIGNEVAIFINYAAATKEDIDGLRAVDVKRVDYLDFPVDSRFLGKPHVVNIIMGTYEYGGYTKVTDLQNIVNGFNNMGNVFSKFVYKDMTFDLYGGFQYNNSNKYGNTLDATATLLHGDVTRKQEYVSSKLKYISVPVTFRASYNTSKVRISNSLGYSFDDVSERWFQGRLVIIPSDGADYLFKQDVPFISRSVNWKGDYYFSLPYNWSLSFAPSAVYSHINSVNNYSTDVPDEEPIVNDAREDAWNLDFLGTLSKNISSKSVVNFNVRGFNNGNDVTYLGSSPYKTKFRMSALSCKVGYVLSLGKVYMNVDGGAIGEFIKTNGEKYDDWYPFAHLSFSWSPNHKNQLSLWFQYATNSPATAERSPNMIQVNELLYKQGSPLIRNSRHTTLSGTYTFMPRNEFMLSAYASYYGSYDRAITVYDYYADKDAILQTFRNDGDFTRVDVGVNATLRLLNNSLILQASPAFSHYASTGYLKIKRSPFSVSLYGQYYFGNFYVSAYYASKGHSVNEETGAYSTTHSFYQVQAGWSNSRWNLKVTAMNFGRYKYDSTRTVVNTPIYNSESILYNANYHAGIQLSATYTFGYGKKVQQGNEIGAQRGASSAIMQ